MKVKDFISYLKTVPQDADVYVVTTSDHGYSGISANYVPIEIDINTEVLDMRNNQFAKGKSYENDVTLYLGET
uniref:Uncharacterized protein n=1 Tax=viral metagenome TaxID=1070528 RepID=A0A6M3LCH0_9ZZZZ